MRALSDDSPLILVSLPFTTMNPHTDQSLRVAHSYIPNHHPTQYSWHIPPSQSHFPSSSSSYTMDSDLEYSEYQHDISALYRYPVSSARDEPYIPPPPPGPNDPPPPEPELLTPVYPPLRPEYQKYIRKYPRLVQKGLMSDGSFTQDHPLVDLYILTVPAKPNYILYPHENPDKEEPEALLFNQVCLLAKPLTPQDEEIIFVLAACKLLGSHKHPKHFTFWSELVWERTMARIHRMLREFLSFVISIPRCLPFILFDSRPIDTLPPLPATYATLSPDIRLPELISFLCLSFFDRERNTSNLR